MRSLLTVVAVSSVLFLAKPAHAQFANRSLGLGAGYMTMNFDNLDRAIPVGVEASVYIENGFDLVFHGYAMLLNSPTFNQQYVGMYLAPGVRYLFSEETLRPYAGLDLGYFQTFGLGNATLQRVGLSPNLGLDWFFQDTWSLGARGQFTAYWMLNQPVNTSLGLFVHVSTWF